MKLCTTVLFLTLAALAPCSGAVIYELTGTSGVMSPPFAVSFEETTASFIVANTTIAAADLDACSTSFEACNQVIFEPVSSHDSGFSSLEFFTTGTSTLFFFDLGSFGAAGVYDTVFGAGTGTLTVTETNVIPEPASATLMLGALAGLIAARRFRK